MLHGAHVWAIALGSCLQSKQIAWLFLQSVKLRSIENAARHNGAATLCVELLEHLILGIAHIFTKPALFQIAFVSSDLQNLHLLKTLF